MTVDRVPPGDRQPTPVTLVLTGSAGQQRPSATKGAQSAGPVRVVLHLDDHPLTKAQELRPLVPPAGALGPREDDRQPAVPLLHAIDPQVVVTFPVAPLDR